MTPRRFDPKWFNKQAERDDALRALLVGSAVLAVGIALLLPGLGVVSSLVAPGLVMGLWLLMSVSTGKVARSLGPIGEAMMPDPARAERLIHETLSVWPVLRWARQLTYHRLAGVYHLQRRFGESAALCLCLLNQPLKGPASATRPHLLLMLAEAQLELGNLPGAYHALAHLQQTRLGLTQALQRLALQTRYEVAVGAYEQALYQSKKKVQLSELMPAAHCATMHAMLATAAGGSDRPRLAGWLWERARLLAPQGLIEQLESGGFGVAVVEHEVADTPGPA